MKLHWMRRTCAALAAATAMLAAAPAATETLTDALIAAYRNSGLLEQSRATLRAADEDVAGAVAQLRPVIRYTTSVTQNVTEGGDPAASLGLSLQQLIYDFGVTRLSVEVQKAIVLSTREALRGVEQDVLLNAVTAYLRVRQALAVVSLRQNNVRVIQMELQAAEDRFEVGEVTRTDVAQAQARLAEARANLALAQGDLEDAREAYKVAVGRYPGDLAEPPPPPETATSLEAARTVARRRHPDIIGAQYAVSARELGIDLAQAQLNPSLSGTVNFSYSNNNNFTDDFEDNASVGLSLSGPIYSGGALAAQIRQSQANRDEARAQLHLSVLQADQNVGNAWTSLRVATSSLSSSERQVRAATIAFEGVQEEATLGARTTLDVLNAEQDLLDARNLRIDAATQRYLAVYQLLAAMGLLTVDHLNLGITTYDPSAYYNAVEDAPVREVSPRGEKLERVLRSLGRN